jgi:hypothetical protein
MNSSAAPVFRRWLAGRSNLAAPIVVVGVCAFFAGVAALFLTETAPSRVAQQNQSAV